MQERFDGASVADRERIAELGLDAHELADRLVQAMVDHMLSHGHFHADPHPGNVLLLDDGDARAHRLRVDRPPRPSPADGAPAR